MPTRCPLGRPVRYLPVVLALAVLQGCGRKEPDPDPSAVPPQSPKAAPPEPRRHREIISPSDEAMQRDQELSPKDTPLTVGATAPTFDGYPARTRAVIVFFRGEW